MCSEGLCPAAVVTALAAALAEGRSIKEIRMLSAVLVQLGETLDTIAVTRECQANAE